MGLLALGATGKVDAKVWAEWLDETNHQLVESLFAPSNLSNEQPNRLALAFKHFIEQRFPLLLALKVINQQ